MAVPVLAASKAQEQAAALSRSLRDAPPICGYSGFTRFARGTVGQTMGEQVRSARELASRPECDAMTSEAWTTPRSVRAASRILMRGNGPRIDLQELNTKEDSAHGLQTIERVRTESAAMMQDPNLRHARVPKVQPAYDPGGPPCVLGLRGHIDSSKLQPAGAPSTSAKLEVIRQEEHRRALLAAIRNDDRPSAIRR
eukprot:TRINITY_DN22604_c0_g1_i1.p1 TRINITY_DN22604_c0_g1~~TRINITY_DN22604_c0_g1_i1.p1  ORF type:complete len:214 (+),score=37.37 TRINITY_DN22604_c0_g1_i1:54-644(+)